MENLPVAVAGSSWVTETASMFQGQHRWGRALRLIGDGSTEKRSGIEGSWYRLLFEEFCCRESSHGAVAVRRENRALCFVLFLEIRGRSACLCAEMSQW